MPSVINHAFHAALHRAAFKGVHEHRRGRSGEYSDERDRKFGSLNTVGPFPVCTNGADHSWFFPRPADANDEGEVILCPHAAAGSSSLQRPCRYPVVSSRPPAKGSSSPWWNEGAWNTYLGSCQRNDLAGRSFRKSDADFSDAEHAYGIGINSETGSVEESVFYSAHYLRLREGWRLGVFASALDKDYQHETYGNDLVRTLLNGNGCEIVAGGQQRVCTATLDPRPYDRLPLPLGRTDGFSISGEGKHLVKWVLLTPAIFPEITAGISKRGTERKAHPGGWLPTWICQKTARILLQTIDATERKRRRNLNAAGKGYKSDPDIDAHLVAALVGKPIPVTGYALPNEADPDRVEGGAKPTHLAVPAGSVYYFECGSAEAAKALAAALNWHGSDANPTSIRNRRSTLMGEKGFGLGVCGTWDFHKKSD